MKLLRDIGSVYDLVREQRQKSKGFVTNFYPDRRRIESWVGRKELYVRRVTGILFLLREDADFYHLYYCASGADVLGSALEELNRTSPGRLVVDIVGREPDVDAMSAPFRQSGYRDHALLRRMMRLAGRAEVEHTRDPEVVFAEAADAQCITGMLHDSLDRFAEQLPHLDEIRAAVGDSSILIVRRGEDIAGLLYFEVAGHTSMLRYWLVGEEYRDQRLGSKLLRGYFAESSGARRFIHWVISTNSNAIARYQHFCYGFDGLFDRVLVN